MVELRSFLNEKLICLDLKSTTKADVFEEMSDLISQSESIPNRGTFLAALKDREAVMTTSLGDGVGIPHARSDSVKDLVVAIGISRNGIDFGAKGDPLVRIVFMFGIPTKETKLYIQVLAKISRFARREDNRERLLSAKSADEILAVFEGFEAGTRSQA
ncbi:MAG: PTS sugar transporter subunit IIA [Candidatus Coatesbacteria bacterium]|nr:PTS sugar transporter subunit IIA [Candidatus Coatesbacteria bacterium]